MNVRPLILGWTRGLVLASTRVSPTFAGECFLRGEVPSLTAPFTSGPDGTQIDQSACGDQTDDWPSVYFPHAKGPPDNQKKECQRLCAGRW